jgi:sugar phosphate isomerase/epimerase
MLFDGLDALLTRAERLGVVVGLENGPTNFLDRAVQVAGVCAEVDRPSLRIVYDVANAQMVEDPAASVTEVLPHLALVHLSDTTRARWAHTRVGRGDVDFEAVSRALDDAGYDGPSLMEIVDLDDPAGALTSSLDALRRWGWHP